MSKKKKNRNKDEETSANNNYSYADIPEEPAACYDSLVRNENAIQSAPINTSMYNQLGKTFYDEKVISLGEPQYDIVITNL